MTWLWIILRCLFPRDPLRQTAEAMRVRAAQLVAAARDAATIQLLQNDPNARLHLELVILDAEDCLRSWISMRGCQIARVRPTMPWARATPHLAHAKSLGHLLARIRDLVIACDEMEQRAQAHALKLTRLREDNPLAAHGSTDAALRAAAHHEAVGAAGFFKCLSGLMVSSNAMLRMALRPSNHEAVLTARATQRAPPHAIAATYPQTHLAGPNLRDHIPMRIDNPAPVNHIPRINRSPPHEAVETRLIPRAVSTPASVSPCFPASRSIASPPKRPATARSLKTSPSPSAPSASASSAATARANPRCSS